MHHASDILSGALFRNLLDGRAYAVARQRTREARRLATAQAQALLSTRKARRAERRAQRLQQAQVPAQIRSALLSPLAPTAALHVVAALGGQRCLAFLSGPGDAGKSTAAGLVVRQRGGVWIDAERLLDAWIGGRREQLLEAPALVLDDLARPGGSIDQRAALAEAVDQLLHIRSQAHRVSVVTLNYSREVLRAFVCASRTGQKPAGERWERLRERLREHGVLPESETLRLLGGDLKFAGFATVPYEGLRDPEKRRQVLAERAGTASSSGQCLKS